MLLETLLTILFILFNFNNKFMFLIIVLQLYIENLCDSKPETIMDHIFKLTFCFTLVKITLSLN
jgi:hypothetical protein